MTHCLALRLDEGLVFLADTRTNAGVDNVSTYRNDSLEIEETRIPSDSPVLERLRELWERHLLAAIDELPDFSAEEMVAPGAWD